MTTMTTNPTARPDQADQLVAVLSTTGPVLLDFDGPVTLLLPAGPNAVLADAARAPLHRAGIDLPEAIASTTDHLAVLRFAAAQSGAVHQAVETVCIAGEIDAASRSTPTPGAHDAMRAFRDAGRPVVVVSNNAAEAIAIYLARHHLSDLVDGVVGRPHGHPDLMKPNPELIHRALQILDTEPHDCVIIGDSVTDIQVSHHAGLRSIGYAKTPRRGTELAEAGADAIVDDMTTLGSTVRRVAALRN